MDLLPRGGGHSPDPVKMGQVKDDHLSDQKEFTFLTPSHTEFLGLLLQFSPFACKMFSSVSSLFLLQAHFVMPRATGKLHIIIAALYWFLPA